MTEIQTVKLPGENIKETIHAIQQEEILNRIHICCNWKRLTFPGSHPVSLSNNNLNLLKSHPYVICEKSDGIRLLLYATRGKVFFIDRNENIQMINLCLPKSNLKKDSNNVIIQQSGTILDGELVYDKIGDETKLTYLVYDAIMINGVDVKPLNYLERLRLANINCVAPRMQLENAYPDIIENEKKFMVYMKIYLKDFFEIWDIAALKVLQNRLPHFSDGFIFTPVFHPYVSGTCKQLLKWKPPNLNTVDFKFKLVHRYSINTKKFTDIIGAKLYLKGDAGDEEVEYWLHNEGDKWNNLVALLESNTTIINSILECHFNQDYITKVPLEISESLANKMIIEYLSDYENSQITSLNNIQIGKDSSNNQFYQLNKEQITFQGAWVFDRIRTDKNTANTIYTMNRVLESIDSKITYPVLYNYILKVWKEKKKLVADFCCLPDYYERHGCRIATIQ